VALHQASVGLSRGYTTKAIIQSSDTAPLNRETNTDAAADRWEKAVDVAHSNYCTRFGKFVGYLISDACTNYAAGVGAVSATDFAQAVSGRQAAYTAGLQSVK
jgi:hypothetical protein